MRYKYIWLFYLFLLSLGIALMSLVSLSLELRLAQQSFSFVKKQVFTSIICIIITYVLSQLSFKYLKRLSYFILVSSLIVTILTLYSGDVINGVHRWIFIMGYCIQSSEILKVSLIIPVALLLTNKKHLLNMLLIFISIGLVLLQPDLGMAFLISITVGMEIFLVGERLWLYIISGIIVIVAAIFSFRFMAWYAAERVLIFLGKTKGFQIKQALKVLSSCNFWGSANYNIYIPDEHCDFIFTKLCASFGIAAGLLYIFSLFFIAYHISKKIRYKNHLSQIIAFVVMFQFFIQNIIHILSNLGFIPTKGMTLPLVGFGSSGMIAYSISFGILLNVLQTNTDC